MMMYFHLWGWLRQIKYEQINLLILPEEVKTTGNTFGINYRKKRKERPTTHGIVPDVCGEIRQQALGLQNMYSSLLFLSLRASLIFSSASFLTMAAMLARYMLIQKSCNMMFSVNPPKLGNSSLFFTMSNLT